MIFLEVTNLKYYEHTWNALRVMDKSATMETKIQINHILSFRDCVPLLRLGCPESVQSF